MQPEPMVWELFELIVVVQVREVAAEKMQKIASKASVLVSNTFSQ